MFHGYGIPSGHMTFIQRRINVDATSWRCIDVGTTLYKRHMSAGKHFLDIIIIVFKGAFTFTPNSDTVYALNIYSVRARFILFIAYSI